MLVVVFLSCIGLILVHQNLCFICIPMGSALRSVRKLSMVNEADASGGHVRRQRYAGTYPRFFRDRHKELRGDSQTISKVIAKGGTPAGQHRPVMLRECLSYLGLTAQDDEKNATPVVVDCTLGYGGHSSAILTAIAPHRGTLYAIDQDSIELAKTKVRMQPTVDNLREEYSYDGKLLYTRHANFGNLLKYTNGLNITGKVTAVLCDLGFSSMQVDDPTRGFSFKADGPLDLRMDTTGVTITNTLHPKRRTPEHLRVPQTAYQYLLDVPSVSALAHVLSSNSDIGPALPIAMALLGPSKAERSPPATTEEFAARVRTALAEYVKKYPKPTATDNKSDSGSKSDTSGSEKTNRILNYADKDVISSTIAKALQALRIQVNAEFIMLDKLLQDLPRILAPGGRAVFLTFHSGEDRRVKKAFKGGTKSGVYSSWSRDVVVASNEERMGNSRSKCAKLRWAVRSDAPCE